MESKMTKSVYVVLLNWNGLSDTLECLASLREQEYSSIKTVVVDNGSAKDEASIIEHDYPDVSVLRQDRNLGFCGGNNVGIRHALADGADYVMILNNDTIAPPQLISELLRASDGLEQVGAVSPLILCHPKSDLIWYAGSVWEPQTAGFRHPLSYESRNKLGASAPFPTAYACGCCLLVSASVLSQVGLMDERYFIYYDEADWSSRMKKAGLECYVIPTAALYHKVSKATPSLIGTYLMARNRLLWMKDHLSWRERMRSCPYLIKEITWNLFNISGLRMKQHGLSTIESRAMLIAIRDFLRGRFGAAPASITKLISRANGKQTI
jgi:GT2 family glycosyltransferase